MSAPLFNNDSGLLAALRASVLAGGTRLNYLTVSDGHVIRFSSERPDCIARFADDASARSALLEAGWAERNDRYFADLDAYSAHKEANAKQS